VKRSCTTHWTAYGKRRRKCGGFIRLARIVCQRGEDQALQAIAVIPQGITVDLTASIALHAAKLSAAHQLPLADSVTLATARAYDAALWTQDADFEGSDDVRYIAKAR